MAWVLGMHAWECLGVLRFRADTMQVTRGRRMFRSLFVTLGFGILCLHASAIFGQTPAPAAVQPCDKACRQAKLDDLFKAMDDAEASQRPKASNSTECSAYAGHDDSDVFLDVCAKHKYVRSLSVGTETRFSCPGDTGALIGVASSRILSAWGEPDLTQDKQPRRPGDGRWTYFIGSPKPGRLGGGFPELSIYLVNGVVTKIDCGLAQ